MARIDNVEIKAIWFKSTKLNRLFFSNANVICNLNMILMMIKKCFSVLMGIIPYLLWWWFYYKYCLLWTLQNSLLQCAAFLLGLHFFLISMSNLPLFLPHYCVTMEVELLDTKRFKNWKQRSHLVVHTFSYYATKTHQDTS